MIDLRAWIMDQRTRPPYARQTDYDLPAPTDRCNTTFVDEASPQRRWQCGRPAVVVIRWGALPTSKLCEECFRDLHEGSKR